MFGVLGSPNTIIKKKLKKQNSTWEYYILCLMLSSSSLLFLVFILTTVHFDFILMHEERTWNWVGREDLGRVEGWEKQDQKNLWTC